MTRIHATAIVDPQAELAEDVEVGPYAIVGPQVRIGARTTVGAHCVIEGRTTIGCDNRIFQFNSIGATSQDIWQDANHRGEVTQLVIGDRNTIREFCTINTGTFKEEGITRIGSDNWIMAYVHIAHDAVLGDHIVMANNATLAGHVHVGDWATIGGLSGIHQWVHVGAHAMIGFQGHVAQDVPPFVTVDGNPLAARAVNQVGLSRRGFSAERIGVIKQIYKALYRKGLTLDAAKAEIETLRGQVAEAEADIDTMLSFLARAQRGIVR